MPETAVHHADGPGNAVCRKKIEAVIKVNENMRTAMKLVVTIPAFNEADTVGAVIQSIPRDVMDEVVVVVLDDGSSDGTARAARKAGADMVVSHTHNMGLAATYRDLLEIATEQLCADVLVNIDADGQYEPGEIERLVTPILEREADIVLGSRFDGSIESMPASKRLGNRLATRVVSHVAGQRFSDCQTGFRAMTRDAALRMNMFSDFTYTQESLVDAVHHNLKVIEVPVTFYERRSQDNRLFGSVWDYAKRGGATLIRTYLYHRPLRVFLLIGILIFLIGGALGLRVLIHYHNTGVVAPYLPTAVLSAVVLIVGFQIIVFGLLADMLRTNQNLHEEILYRLKKQNGGGR
jgi:glycosyltransferase involved in cell wall biosynthesis